MVPYLAPNALVATSFKKLVAAYRVVKFNTEGPVFPFDQKTL